MAQSWNAWMDWVDALPWHHPVSLVIMAVPIVVLFAAKILIRRGGEREPEKTEDGGHWEIGPMIPIAVALLVFLVVAGLGLSRFAAWAGYTSQGTVQAAGMHEVIPDEVYVGKCLRNSDLLFSSKCDFENHELQDRVETARSHRRLFGR